MTTPIDAARQRVAQTEAVLDKLRSRRSEAMQADRRFEREWSAWATVAGQALASGQPMPPEPQRTELAQEVLVAACHAASGVALDAQRELVALEAAARRGGLRG